MPPNRHTVNGVLIEIICYKPQQTADVTSYYRYVGYVCYGVGLPHIYLIACTAHVIAQSYKVAYQYHTSALNFQLNLDNRKPHPPHVCCTQHHHRPHN